MTLNRAIMELVMLSEHPMMPVIFKPSMQKIIETVSECEERKIGEWIYDWGDWDFETCKCSECGNHMTTPIGERYSFCPNCGCKMEVGNEPKEV